MPTSLIVTPLLEVLDEARSRRTRIIPADRLFQGVREVLIAHNACTYRLRITKSGKLILTK